MSEDLLALFQTQEPLDCELEARIRPGPLGPAVHHPLIVEVLYVPHLNAMLNRRLAAKKKVVAQALRDRDWSRYLLMHERPYRLDALVMALGSGLREADPATTGDVLNYVWTDSENIHEGFDVWYELLEDDDLRDAWRASMSDEERADLASLPDAVPIYRGCSCNEAVEGFSWTTNRNKAVWFARRFKRDDTDALVASGTVSREHIVAFYQGRNEHEVVVLPDLVAVESVEDVG